MAGQSGLPFENVTALGYDAAGKRAWFGSDDGHLARYANGQIVPVEVPEQAGITRVNALVFQNDGTSDGRLWVGTPIGLFSLSSGSWRHYQTEDGLPGNEITTLVMIGDTLFIGTLDGLARWFGASFQTISEDDGLPSNQVTALAVAEDVLWVGTTGGLARVDGEVIESWEEKDGLLNQWVTALAVESYPDKIDNEPRVWIGTTLGLCRFEPESSWEPWTYYSEEDGLSGNWITALALETKAAEQQRLWVASQAGGLDSLWLQSGEQPGDLEITRFNQANTGVPLDRITCLVSCRPVWPHSGNDVMLIGTATSGVVRVFMITITAADAEKDPFKDSEDPVLLILHSIPYNIRDMIRWRTWLVVGTDRGLVFCNTGRRVAALKLWDGGVINVKPFGQFYFGADNFPVPSLMLKVTDLLVDNQDNLWAATQQNGVLFFDEMQWLIYDKKHHGLASNHITALSRTVHGAGIYAAAQTRSRRLPQRITWFDGEKWQQLDQVLEAYKQESTTGDGPGRPEKQGVPDSGFDQVDAAPYSPKKITGMASRKDGVYFVAVHGLGLCVFDSQNWTVYRSTPQDRKLISNYIIDLHLDRFDNLWIVAPRGLGCLTLDGRWMSFSCTGHIVYSNIQDMVFDDRTTFALYLFAYTMELETGAVYRTDLKDWTSIASIGFGVMTLAIDSNYLWLGTRKGLIRLSK